MPDSLLKLERLTSLSAWQMRVLLSAPFILFLSWYRLRTMGYVASLEKITDAEAAKDTTEDSLDKAQDTQYALAVAIKYGPWRPRCLLRSMALGWYLERSGVPFEIHIGVPVEQKLTGADGATDFSSHAWVESNGVVLNDKPNIAEKYKVFRKSEFIRDDVNPADIKKESP